MKAPDESGINKDFIVKSTDWIVATASCKRCTDADDSPLRDTLASSTGAEEYLLSRSFY